MTKPSIPQGSSREKRSHAPPGMAYCSKCDKYKDTDEFRKDRKMPSGFSYMCKECTACLYPRRVTTRKK